ncbi:MAG TPA: hypothetical protein VME46_13595 [Acidimicrobiales bacterium]|nr:hypothetical protein [Acidimicrobiales bacterium]
MSLPSCQARAALPLVEAARRAGAAAWLEARLYEVVGAWTGTTNDPQLKVWFEIASQHHAWRAELWRARLPARLVPNYPPGDDGTSGRAPASDPLAAGRGTGHGGANMVRPPSDRDEVALSLLAGLSGDAVRLAVYGRVVQPRVIALYRQWWAACSPASDGPIARALRMAITDAAEDWQSGTELLGELLAGPGGEELLARAAHASVQVELAILAAGWGTDWGLGA